MADAPWRCSECGTVNEPVANACRTCGRWPSLFDLERNSVAEAQTAVVVEEHHGHPPMAEHVEQQVEFEHEAFDVEEVDASEAELESPTARGRRLLGSIIVPLAVVVYVVISILVER